MSGGSAQSSQRSAQALPRRRAPDGTRRTGASISLSLQMAIAEATEGSTHLGTVFTRHPSFCHHARKTAFPGEKIPVSHNPEPLIAGSVMRQQGGLGGPISRVLSPPRGEGGDHSSGPAVAGRLKQPTRSASEGNSRTNCPAQRPDAAAWPCTRWGLPCLTCHQASGALLPHLFTLACGRNPSAVCFLWHFPVPARHQAGRWVLPTTVSIPCSDFPPAKR